MRRKVVPKWLYLSLLILFLLPLNNGEAKKKVEFVGEETSYFSLPSTDDRLISYLNEYYGKYHLIMTFFPAAFTPV